MEEYIKKSDHELIVENLTKQLTQVTTQRSVDDDLEQALARIEILETWLAKMIDLAYGGGKEATTPEYQIAVSQARDVLKDKISLANGAKPGVP